jgi:hypothetical protein
VREQGVSWTVDQMVVDVGRRAKVLEWTRFNRARDRLIRGVDWFVFKTETLFDSKGSSLHGR